MSRFDTGKGLPEAINAFRMVADQFPDTSLIIVGDGPEKIPMQAFVYDNRTNNVRFCGYVNDDQKRAAFLDAGIYFFPTMFGERVRGIKGQDRSTNI